MCIRDRPQVARRVAEFSIPLGPQWREVADLVPALPDVPGLGDQLHLADHRVLLHQVEERRQPVHLVELPRQRRRQIEAEAVHPHLGRPVAQRVHDELQHVRAAHQQRIARAGGVHVVARIVRQSVVRGVVQAPEGQRGAQVVALGRVVVDHVQDHLDARLVQRPHSGLELQHLLTPVAPRRVGVVRREEADGVVPPVVGQPGVHQPVVVDELMHRHQFDRRHPELRQVLQHRGMRQRRVRTPHLLRQRRVKHRQALHVGLVDDRAVVVRPRRPVVAPVEVRIDHHRSHHVRRGIHVIALLRTPEAIAVDGLAPVHRAAHGLRVRVEQQLGGVAPLPPLRLVRAVRPEAVPLPRHDARQIGVAHERVALAQLHRRLRAVVVQQTQLDALGGLGEDREIGPGAVVRGAERVRLSRPDLHDLSLPPRAPLSADLRESGADLHKSGADRRQSGADRRRSRSAVRVTTTLLAMNQLTSPRGHFGQPPRPTRELAGRPLGGGCTASRPHSTLP